MVLSALEFLRMLGAACPETKAIVDAHLRDLDNELLLHVLIADVRRFAIERFEANDTSKLTCCLDVVATGLTDGDEYVENAVAVSFVEDTGLWDPEMEPFIAMWPSPLLVEAKRQRAWRGRHARGS